MFECNECHSPSPSVRSKALRWRA